MAAGILYIIATPIGNLSDMTFRAVETLKNSDLIIAEDTRVTMKLLNHYGIKTPAESFHKFNENDKSGHIMSLLARGKKIGMVSDAGTPLLSDPGYGIVKLCIKQGYRVEVIPGASSVVSAAVLSGFDPARFLFWGFLGKTEKARDGELAGISVIKYPVVIFESPKRVLETLEAITRAMPERQVAVVKELTKIHEAVFRGTPAQAAAMLNEENLKGEFIIVIGPVQETRAAGPEEITAMLKELMETGISASDAVKNTAAVLKAPKNDVYKIANHLKKEG
ncbi:MAG: 16S rRNA (cytidine(1402)-2'-O)-methyltransferase [Spirochaetia bacterium]|nr:16S rRNA (cytidine(1402)-2'-O)-methyltransferase [Spirochaetia bacterium]